MINDVELIERWVNVDRVLTSMPEHERQEHWDMSRWGRKTACGTVACAAGHCGLDPWFRERGFKLDFVGVEAQISEPVPFFGLWGSQIFYDQTRRPVETVIEEVRTHLGYLREAAALTAKARVRTGEYWPGEGGVFAGAMPAFGGAAPYYLIVGPEYNGVLNWSDANAWAADLEVDGQRGCALPQPVEQLMKFDRVRALFAPDWYWSGKQHGSCSCNAWTQHFNGGHQTNWHKHSELRARAVRRLPI